MSSTFRAIESPCVKVCAIDPESDLCVGCNRTLDEIARWASFSHAERRKIMASLASRRPDLDSGKRSA